MEELLKILNEIHSDVDYETCTTLIDDGILDSFDIIPIITEVNEVLFHGKDAATTVSDLMLRDKKLENSSIPWE